MRLLTYLNKSENSIGLLIAIAAVSMSYPYGFPLFGIVTLLFVILKLFSGKLKVRFNIGFLLFFGSILFYLFGMALNSGVLYSNNISDLTNIFSLLLVWILLSDLDRSEIPTLINKAARFTTLFMIFVSVASLLKFYRLLNGVKLDQYFVGDYYPTGTSLVRDYNMYSYAMAFSLIMTLFLLRNTNKMISILFYSACLILNFACIIFAGSRRGWIVAGLILIILVYSFIKFLLRFSTKRLLKYSFSALLIIFLSMSISKIFEIDLNFSDSYQMQKMIARYETLQLSNPNESLSERTLRWDYAGELYNDYNAAEFIFGSGFDYLPKYASNFNSDTIEDYPHNPFLSALLYSGLVGLIFLLVTFFWGTVMLFKNFKVVGVYFSLIYFISWIYILVSSNSFFSVSLFLILHITLLSIPKETSTKSIKLNPSL